MERIVLVLVRSIFLLSESKHSRLEGERTELPITPIQAMAGARREVAMLSDWGSRMTEILFG